MVEYLDILKEIEKEMDAIEWVHPRPSRYNFENIVQLKTTRFPALDAWRIIYKFIAAIITFIVLEKLYDKYLRDRKMGVKMIILYQFVVMLVLPMIFLMFDSYRKNPSKHEIQSMMLAEYVASNMSVDQKLLDTFKPYGFDSFMNRSPDKQRDVPIRKIPFVAIEDSFRYLKLLFTKELKMLLVETFTRSAPII